jgi:nucleotide-binding universal stress UspA family protein
MAFDLHQDLIAAAFYSESGKGENMYKHILIPTDGSETAEKAVEEGLKFAKWSGARVTAFTAVPEYQIPSGEIVSRRVESLSDFERRSAEEAKALLERVAERARAAGVECGADYAVSDRPWQAIIKSAEKNGCDLIFIASHGRKGLSALLHGSETREVLTHSSIPTLVYR